MIKSNKFKIVVEIFVKIKFIKFIKFVILIISIIVNVSIIFLQSIIVFSLFNKSKKFDTNEQNFDSSKKNVVIIDSIIVLKNETQLSKIENKKIEKLIERKMIIAINIKISNLFTNFFSLFVFKFFNFKFLQSNFSIFNVSIYFRKRKRLFTMNFEISFFALINNAHNFFKKNFKFEKNHDF